MELLQIVNARGIEVSFWEIGEGLVQLEVETGAGYTPTVKPMAVSGSDIWIRIGRKRAPGSDKAKA